MIDDFYTFHLSHYFTFHVIISLKVAKDKNKIDNVLSTSRIFKLKKTIFISSRAIKKRKKKNFQFTFNQSLKIRKKIKINKIKTKVKNVSDVYFLKVNKIYVNDGAIIEYLSLKFNFDLFVLTKINQSILKL